MNARLLVAAPVLAVALAACGGGGAGGDYTAATIERNMPDHLSAEGHPGMTVACPPLVDRPGARTVCTATGKLGDQHRLVLTRDKDRHGYAWAFTGQVEG